MHKRGTGRFAGFTCSEISAFSTLITPKAGFPGGMMGSKDDLAGSQPKRLATWDAIMF